jgi:hypothetical protein
MRELSGSLVCRLDSGVFIDEHERSFLPKLVDEHEELLILPKEARFRKTRLSMRRTPPRDDSSCDPSPDRRPGGGKTRGTLGGG